ncbi:helix-turn-helix domain-containing protein [Candidatus Daviesbacteria bacterium]|nr:helix-turn-helix domain-containing protein [Candidatus Daviesbacteria bacterium]
MAKAVLRQKATKLRLQGYTYGQIKRELNLAKSTLSDWLKNLPLPENTLKQLSKNRKISRDIRIERFRQTCKKSWISRLSQILESQGEEILPLTVKELFLAGVFLYWGEGSKQRGVVTISNTDPRVIKFALYWMIKALKVPKERIRIRLHLYSDMNLKEETDFWSQVLDIPHSQFKSPYVKKTTRKGLTYKSFGHGTCNIMYFSVTLSEKIAMTIKAVSEFYGEKSELFWYN